MGHFWKGRCFQDKCIEMYSTFERQVGFSIRYIVFCRPLSANEGSNGMICRQNIGYCAVCTYVLYPCTCCTGKVTLYWRVYSSTDNR